MVSGETPWPLGQTEKELLSGKQLPIMFPGQERFGEKSVFMNWIKQFQTRCNFRTHLDFQMFSTCSRSRKLQAHATPTISMNQKGKLFNSKAKNGYGELKLFKRVSKSVPAGNGLATSTLSMDNHVYHQWQELCRCR